MEAFIVNCKPDNWKTCNKHTIFGLKDANSLPPLAKGDLILFRISGPNYGLKALWYFDYAKKIVNKKNILLSDEDYAWILNCKNIITLPQRFSEEFQTSSKKSSKITDLYAGGIQRAVVAIKKPQLRDYIFHILKEYKNELNVNINYLGEEVNADDLLQKILAEIVAVEPFPESEEYKINETNSLQKEKLDKQISEQKEKSDKPASGQKHEPAEPVLVKKKEFDKQSSQKEKLDKLVPEQRQEPDKPIFIREKEIDKQIPEQKEKLNKLVPVQKREPDKSIFIREKDIDKQIPEQKEKSDKPASEQKREPDEPIFIREKEIDKQIPEQKEKIDRPVPEQKQEPDKPVLVQEKELDRQVPKQIETPEKIEIELEEINDGSVTEKEKDSDKYILEKEEDLEESIFELQENVNEPENNVPAKFSNQHFDEQVGERINLPILNYAPLNKKGIILLFGHYMQKLGISHVEEIKTGFPDVIAIRSLGNGKYQRVRIGFECNSSSLLKKGYKISECDLIICWKHDWNGCPVEIIELSKVLFKL